MFSFMYIRRELRRRSGRTIVTALGLALGVGLVIGIVGVSQGLDDAQNEVLAPLGSVGTDVLVTRVAGSTTSNGTATAAQPTPQPVAGGFFAGGGPGGRGAINGADIAAIAEENNNVTTDLAKLGKAGTKFTHDFFLSATLLSFPSDAVEEVAKLPGVTSAVGGLVQLAQHQTGTVPEIVASIQTGGQTFEQTTRPAPMTEKERLAFQACLTKAGVDTGPPANQPTPGPTPAPGPGQGTGLGRGQASNPAFEQCLPARFRELRVRFTTPLQTIRQVIDPPSTDITTTSYTAAGIDPAHPESGLVTQSQLTEGRWPTAGSQVLLNVAYANTKSLKVGSTLPINGTTYTVVGLVSPTLTGSTADVYFTLATLQKLAGKDGRVTQVLVKVGKAEDVDAVAAAIKTQLPGAEVITTKALADQVTGSLADAQELTRNLGGALAVIVLVAAFVIAVLLTLSSIGKRVREIGTLRAIGWSKARVVRQLLGETMGIGLLGGLLGLGVGVAVAAAVGMFGPTLDATSSGIPGMASSSLATFFGQATAAAQTTQVEMTAPLHLTTLLAGVGFALLGGLIAGVIGGWRAARLTPVVALGNLG